ncbi:MAG TPA: PAS domain-containing sensor histidine kinase [Dissulfurispiraceae bacterium]|nr:PAS domain-containing sensor histidine kinase [Dissulfurispiraceae bacterium]
MHGPFGLIVAFSLFPYNQLMAKERLYEIIVKHLPHGFMVVDRNGMTVDFNAAAEQITGYSREEVLGKSHFEIFHRASDQTECPLWRHAFEQQHKMLAVEHVITKKNGDSAILSVGIAPLFDGDGNFMGGIELLRDITDQKKRERERQNVLSMFAHDMKNSVLIAQGFINRMEAGKSGPIPEEQRGGLGTVHQELATLEKLILDFLQFSRFEANQYTPVKKAFPIAPALEYCIESIRNAAEDKAQHLHLDLPDAAIPQLHADEEMVKRAVINLLDNAVKYTPVGGEIVAKLGIQADTVTIAIRDTGIGIAEENLPYIFDAFYRIDKGTKGSGLGLFIVKTIVDAHCGSIAVQSAPGKGSTFTISLPV